MSATNLQTAINALLGDDDLDRFVRGRRLDGLSWRSIAGNLYDVTGVEVPAETIRKWYGGQDFTEEMAP